MSIKENVEMVTEEIKQLKIEHHINNTITLCAATKYVGTHELEALLTAGVFHFGENRVNDFLEKHQALQNESIVWHFIGSLQTNKVRKMINKIDFLHSLDRLSLAQEINKRRLQPLNCFIEVNCSLEENKHGLNENEVIPFIQSLQDYDKIKVIGLMTMAEHTDDQLVVRNTFRKLKTIQEKIKKLNLKNAPCQELSMGMSNDYQIAIEEGATFIRIGSRLFK